MPQCTLEKERYMATIQKRGDSYYIRVSCGYNSSGKQMTQTKTWKPEPNMTAKQIEKEVKRQAVLFEELCMKGYQSQAVKFEVFAEQWFEEYAKPNLRNTTYERMLQLRKRIYAAFGHLRMDDHAETDSGVYQHAVQGWCQRAHRQAAGAENDPS